MKKLRRLALPLALVLTLGSCGGQGGGDGACITLLGLLGTCA